MRVKAADALYHIQPHTKAVMRALLVAMRDSAQEVRTSVAVALGAIGASGIPALTDAIGDDHASVRAIALDMIGGQGRPAVSALPAITRALKDSSTDVRAAAAFALDRLGTDVVGADRDARAALVSATRDPVVPVRAAALRALLSVASDSSLLWQVARRALVDSAPAVRQSAVLMLLASRRSPSELVAVLSGMARDPNAGVRGTVYRIVGGLLSTSVSASARQVLLDASRDPDPTARTAAANALTSTSRAYPLSVPVTLRPERPECRDARRRHVPVGWCSGRS